MATNLPAVLTRINHSGNLGTIRFVGNVSNTPGIWLGVEWDDPQRGKHDGVKDGHRYFTCSVPNSGSFIRPSSSINYGVAFTHALISKYIEVPHGAQTLETVLLGSSNGVIEVEAVGLDKIRGKLARLERLREISLDIENVASADPLGEIRNKCPNVRGLDLTKNLLPTWDTVALIARELSFLERLALNQNRLCLSLDPTLMSSSFLNLVEIQLNGTLTTWQELTQSLLPFMPKIEAVELGYNRLDALAGRTTIPSTHTSPSDLQTLNLDGNNLSDWNDISKSLDPYPALTRLILISNRLDNIRLAGETNSDGVARLKHLALSFNNITSWSCVDSLAVQCPHLETLSLTGNPLIEDTNYRPFVVARIGTLTSLNGAAISSKERIDCELFYLSHIVQHGPLSEEERSRKHPRYRDLCMKHGADTVGKPINQRQDTLGNRLIELNIHRTSVAPHNGDPVSTISLSSSTILRVLPSMNLRTLRLKICKTFKAALKSNPRLYLQMNDDVVSTLLPEQDVYDLAWWGLTNGANIFVYIGSE